MKILTVSDSPTLCSGLARVHRHVVDGLLEAGHSVLPCGWYAFDDFQIAKIKSGKMAATVKYRSSKGDIPVLNVSKNNGHKDMFDIYDAVRHIRPDAVITIGDHWHFWYMRKIKIKTDFSFAWIPYLTIEHDEIEDKWNKLFDYAEALVVPTRFGQEALESFSGRPVDFVPYGTEKSFFRMPEETRKRLKMENGCEGKVRFITVAQNTFRKNLPALLQAIRHISHRDPDRRMQFHIHTNIHAQDREEYLYDLKAIASKLGIQDRIVFPQDDKTVSIFEAPGDDYMNEQYALADFFVLPSTCEGYGLTLCEAMACGIPAIVNSASTMTEHIGTDKGQNNGWASRGFLVDNRTEIYPPSRIIKVIKPEALGEAIWEAFLLSQDKDRYRILEGMRDLCEEYGKGRTWESMKTELCDVVGKVAGRPLVAIEEL